MTRETVEPTITPTPDDPMHRAKVTHPCYATISANRISGSAVLFEGEVAHHGTVRLTIQEATKYEDPHSTHVHSGAGRRVAEVEMTETQWVALVSRMNHGSGTPCTLRGYRDGDKWRDVPGLPYEATGAEKLTDRERQIIEGTQAKIDTALAAAREAVAKLPKKVQAEVMSALERLNQHAISNLDFSKQVLAKQNEKLVVAAKVEVDAMIAGAVTNLGLAGVEQLGAVLAADPKALLQLAAPKEGG